MVVLEIPKQSPPKLQDSSWGESFHSFLECCLQKNPKDRLTSFELLKVRTEKIFHEELKFLFYF